MDAVEKIIRVINYPINDSKNSDENEDDSFISGLLGNEFRNLEQKQFHKVFPNI